MAEQFASRSAPGPIEPVGPGGGPATPPRVLPWMLAYTVGRLVIAAALVALLWLLGLSSFPGLLFGLLLSMPAAYVLLRPVRERLTEALAARTLRKAEFRARLRGTDDDSAA